MKRTQQMIHGALIVGGLLTGTLSLGACGGPAKHESVGLAPVVARLGAAQRLTVPRQVEVYGTVQADRSAAISARVMAMVAATHVKNGDRVRRGQLLLEIDPQAAQGQVAQARGGLAQARAGLALAERNHERFQALAETNAASEVELDMARMQYEQARGAVEQAEGAVSAATSVAADSHVTAPFDGRVARRMVEVGDLAAPGRPLLMLESERGRRLVAHVPEQLMIRSGVAVGDNLTVTVDARPDLGRLQGTVIETTPGADPATLSFDVEISLPIDDLATGGSGRAWLAGDTRTAVVAPAAAVLERGGVSMVVVRTDEGLASSRVVSVGASLGAGRVEILSGLAGDETLLLDLTTAPPSGSPVEARS